MSAVCCSLLTLVAPRVWCSVNSWPILATEGVTKRKQLSWCIKSENAKTEGSYYPVNGG